MSDVHVKKQIWTPLKLEMKSKKICVQQDKPAVEPLSRVFDTWEHNWREPGALSPFTETFFSHLVTCSTLMWAPSPVALTMCIHVIGDQGGHGLASRCLEAKSQCQSTVCTSAWVCLCACHSTTSETGCSCATWRQTSHQQLIRSDKWKIWLTPASKALFYLLIFIFSVYLQNRYLSAESYTRIQ